MTQLEAGQRFGPFEIRGALGRGGMASVYRANEVALDRDVALKVLPAELVGQPGFVERFEREARALAKLDHDHVAPLYAFGIEGGVPWMSMRLLDGGSLDARLRERRLDTDALVAVLRGVADALAAAHARGVVHRDVKPSNILFDARGKAYLSDFGIATGHGAALDLTGSGVIGTPRYASPEQAMGLPVDGRSDVYALGVVAFEALVGRAPFEGASAFSVLKQHVEEPPPLALLPEPARDVVGRALAKDPARRWSGAPEFVDALAAALAGTAPHHGTLTTPIHRRVVPYTLNAFLARLRERKVAQWTLGYAGAAWVLLQVLDFVGARFGWPDMIGRILIVALGWGIAAVAILAWYHGERGAQRMTRGELGLLALVLAAAAATLVALGEPPARATLVSAALGPGDKAFVAVEVDADEVDAGDAEKAYAAGVQRELVATLSQMSRLRAAADGDGSVAGATHRLTGKIHRADGKLHESYGLFDLRDGRQILDVADVGSPTGPDAQVNRARGMTRALRVVLDDTDRFAPGFPTTQNVKALDLYLQARAVYAGGGGSAARTLELLGAAIDADPAFAQAHAAAAVFGAIAANPRAGVLQAADRAREALAAARRLQPDMPETRIAEGWVALFVEHDAQRALAAFDAAANGAPNHPDLLRGEAFALRALGRPGEALGQFDRLVAADPFDEWAISNVGLLLQELKQYERAERYFAVQSGVYPRWAQFGVWQMRGMFLRDADLARLKQSLDGWQRKFELHDDAPQLRSLRLEAAVLGDDVDEALRLLDAMPPGPLVQSGYPPLISSPPVVSSLRAFLLRRAGRTFEAARAYEAELAWWRKLVAADPGEVMAVVSLAWTQALAGEPGAAAAVADAARRVDALPPSRAEDRAMLRVALAGALAWLDDRDAAFAAVEKSLEEPFGLHPAQLARDPMWAPLRDDPRYRALLAERGFAFALDSPAAR